MALNLASPGILIREVDLTIGRIDGTTGKVGGIVGSFEKGPVGEPTVVTGENDLFDLFGQPYDTDKQYETWMVASSYLAYGGTLSVIRADDYNATTGVGLKNAFVGSGISSVRLKSSEHYQELGYQENTLDTVTVAARNPGSWANGIRIAIIDGKADQILGLSTTGVNNFTAAVSNKSGTLVGSASTILFAGNTTGIAIGQEVLCDVAGVVPEGTTVTAVPAGAAAGIVTVSKASTSATDLTTTFDFGTTTVVQKALTVGYGVTQQVPANTVISGAGGTSLLDGFFKGVITEVGTGEASVKFVSHVSGVGTETAQDFNSLYKFSGSGTVAIHTNGVAASYGSTVVTSQKDWFDQQTYEVTTSSVGGDDTTVTAKWNAIADKPGTSEYASARGGRFDEVHVVVIDAKGTISGNAGTVLEKHLNLSKAKDAVFSVGSPSYWRKYLYTNSDNIFGLSGAIIGVTTTGFAANNFNLFGDGSWDQNAEGVIFNSSGKQNLQFAGGTNYGGVVPITGDGSTGALNSGLGDLIGGYQIFENDGVNNVDFLLMGGGHLGKDSTRQLATTMIGVAEERKDAVAFISPSRDQILSDTEDDGAVTVFSDQDITDNLADFYDPITSTTFGVFDSGYKYMYDRFNETFRYIPLNGDIAGLCARTDINDFPWFSPAGTDRGAILNAVKLPYNPTRLQRDKLYSNRINPVINSPGAGIILFGDKTGFAKASAFDRINVRRLFIYLEQGIAAAAKDQLFEFNDEITRANFVNIVEPFLRDVQSKRGIQDYVVICDETNNTAAVIDNNEFIADIFIKPARSINFIGLTFVATRTGISFEEVIGSV